MERAIPVIDLDKFVHGNEDERGQIVEELGKALHDVGFVGVINHGIPQDLVDRYYDSAKRFFSMSSEIKGKYEVAGLAGQRGYTSFGKEHARQSTVGDLKEFFQMGQEVTDQPVDKDEYPDNVIVEEIPEFNTLGRQLYRVFEKSGGQLLRAIALHLGLEETYFESQIHNGNSILRAIHYPAITEEPKSAIRAEQHEDINLITLLIGSQEEGLQILSRDGSWIPVTSLPGTIVVNIGDMMKRLTNHVLPSTPHRVVNPPAAKLDQPRYSIPFFMHPNPDFVIETLPGCVSAQRPNRYPQPITANDFLLQRLRENKML